jgi:uncharacterized protein YgiM (DUF1202 family)
MQSRDKLPAVVVLTFLFIACFALSSTVFAEAPAADEVVKTPEFPYLGEIIGENVYVRSGPGTNHYTCSKLNKGDRVKVVSSKFSWSCIVPPEGSFSLISSQYVDVDAADPTVGTVSGDRVRVYAGSDHQKQIRSEKLQLKLDKGDKVKLLGKEEGDYYKIAPPSGAYLWVSDEFITPVTASVTTVEDKSKSQPEAGTDAVVVPTTVSVEARKLQKYYELEKLIKAEKAKPAEQQDYTEIKKAILEIAGNAEAGKAKRYAEFGAKQIERFELALKAAKELQLQEQQLGVIKEQIDKARKVKLAQVPDLGQYAVIGILQASNIYSSGADLQRYKIVDSLDKIMCYAVPTSSMELSGFVSKKVGLVGTIESLPQAASALVRFSKIDEVK